jgi:hypothetical protein
VIFQHPAYQAERSAEDEVPEYLGGHSVTALK